MLCCMLSSSLIYQTTTRHSHSSSNDKRVQCSRQNFFCRNVCCYKSTTRMARQRLANVTVTTARMSGGVMDCNWTDVCTIHGRPSCCAFVEDVLQHIQNTQWTNYRSNDGPFRLNCEWSSQHLCADDKANEAWASAAVIHSQSDPFRCMNKHYRPANKNHIAVTVTFYEKSHKATLPCQNRWNNHWGFRRKPSRPTAWPTCAASISCFNCHPHFPHGPCKACHRLSIHVPCQCLKNARTQNLHSVFFSSIK